MRAWIGCSLAVLLMSVVFAEQPPTTAKKETATWRTVGTVAGAGGGFVLGAFLGISQYDDAIHADRKITAVALACAAAAGVGGYFIGRAVDKHNAIAWKLDPMDRGLLHAQNAWSIKSGNR